MRVMRRVLHATPEKLRVVFGALWRFLSRASSRTLWGASLQRFTKTRLRAPLVGAGHCDKWETFHQAVTQFFVLQRTHLVFPYTGLQNMWRVDHFSNTFLSNLK